MSRRGGTEKSLLSVRRRAYVLLAVLAFAAGPALRLDCLLSCAIPEPAGLSSCHGQSQPDVSVEQAAGHCATEVLPAAVTANRAGDRTLVPIAVAGGAATQPALIAPADPDARVPLAAPAQAPSHRLPLRI